MAKPLWKPSRRSQANLKEHIKERNKKSSGLRKACEHSSASANDTTSSRARLKSIQANNRALALALQEQKVKVREARDAFTLLKGENQCLKFQIFYLQALLQLQQVQNVGMFPSVPVMIPVVTVREHCAVPQHIVKLEEIPEGEMNATTDDRESFEPSHRCLQDVTGTAYSCLSTGITVVHPHVKGYYL
ncbi:uncharacterized protein FN964_001508 isoform 3-T4 [Alca torda]